MKRYLILLIFMVRWCGFLGANVPQNLSPKPYEEQTLWERFTNWNVPNLETKNEVRLGLSSLDISFISTLSDNNLGGGLKDAYLSSMQQAGGRYIYTSPQLSFMARWGKRWEYGVSTLFSQARQNLYNTVTGDVIRSQRHNVWLIAPTCRWNIIRWEWLRFYMQMGMNCFLVSESGVGSDYKSEVFFGYGYTIGKKIFFFSEGNYGGESTVVTMGIGYRF